MLWVPRVNHTELLLGGGHVGGGTTIRGADRVGDVDDDAAADPPSRRSDVVVEARRRVRTILRPCAAV